MNKLYIRSTLIKIEKDIIEKYNSFFGETKWNIFTYLEHEFEIFQDADEMFLYECRNLDKLMVFLMMHSNTLIEKQVYTSYIIMD